MADPPGSTPSVRFDTAPLVSLLHGPDAAAGFVSTEVKGPGSTSSVAFDTAPPLWFDFPALAPSSEGGAPPTAGPSPAATRATPGRVPPSAAAARGSHVAARPRGGRPRRTAAPVTAPGRSRSPGTLASTGADPTPGVLGLAVLALGWVVRRRNAAPRMDP